MKEFTASEKISNDTKKTTKPIPNILWRAKADKNGKLFDTYISETADYLLELLPGTINNNWDRYFSYVHQDDLPGLIRLITESIQNLGNFGYEYRLITQTGKIKHVYSNGNVFYDNKSGFVQGFGVTTDLTALKQKDAELKKSEQKYKALLNILPYPVVVHRGESITFLNSATMQFAGAQAEHEIEQSNLFNFVHPDDRKRVTEKISLAMTEEIPIELEEERFITPAGEIRHVEVRGLPFIDTDGEKSLLVAFSDITERKKAQQALTESEKRYKTLFNLAPFPILAHCNGKIVLYNKKFTEYLGTNDHQIITHKTVTDFIHPDSRPNIAKRISKILQTGKSSEVEEERFISYTGQQYDMEVASSLFMYENRKAVLTVMNDITERKKDKKALEELIATKDRFFSIIAHDLKNPFHQILGFGEIIETAPDDFDLDHTRKIVRYMYNSAQKGYALLENLLEWSRAQTGRIKFTPQPINIKDIILHETDFIKNAADKKAILINYKTESKLPDAYADKDMLKTILRNLLSNAVKFTLPGGKIFLKVKQEKDMLKLSVSDTGIGIPPERIEKLFKIDESTSTPGTDNESGTGLGLILCKEFAEKNNGRIEIHSTPGKGSTFTVYIPTI